MNKGNILLTALLFASSNALKANHFFSTSPLNYTDNYNYHGHQESSTGSLLVLLTLLAVVGGFICYMIYLCKRKCEGAQEPDLSLTARQGEQHRNVNNFND